MTRNAAPQKNALRHAADAMALPIRLDDEFVLRLPQDPDELTLAELDELRQWLDDTLRADRRHYLVLGSCAQDSTKPDPSAGPPDRAPGGPGWSPTPSAAPTTG
jgi:hypothetical protein